ncbi:MAG: DNA methylase [Prevotellaceae bacterium]|jgi:hypothetical protein|nr:DNA methylase [Prevotellaceae bacterium]
MTAELNKYFTSKTVEIWRSEIETAYYNPRKISNEARRKLKQNIKKNGIIGGLVWNERTGILVSGHQRLAILDELNKYDSCDKETDYKLKVEALDVDEKTEKELNVWFNNTQVQGEWDYDKLASLIPDIDYKNAGLTDADLQFIGIDFTVQTDAEKDIAKDFDNMLAPVIEQNELKKQAVKEAKKQISEEAEAKVKNTESYVVVNFDTRRAKEAFMRRFGFDAREKFIKGELFSEMIERIE